MRCPKSRHPVLGRQLPGRTLESTGHVDRADFKRSDATPRVEEVQRLSSSHTAPIWQVDGLPKLENPWVRLGIDLI